jgi:hypothetical protein
MEDFFEFEPTSDNIKLVKKLLKRDGDVVCQGKINRSWLDESMSTFSFGLGYTSKKAQTGRRLSCLHSKQASFRSEANKHVLYGFILCRVDIHDPKVVWIDIVCSKENSKIGKLLMEAAEERIKANKSLKLIQLYSLPEVRLKNWYVKLGYTYSESKFWGDTPKAYLLHKFL